MITDGKFFDFDTKIGPLPSEGIGPITDWHAGGDFAVVLGN